MEENIKVYVKVNSNNIITNMLSDIEANIMGISIMDWIQIDEGQGDKYAHASSSYLENGIRDMQGRCNYKLVDGKVIELADEEKMSLFPVEQPQPTQEEKQAELINNLILDNLNMQAQLDTLITSGLGGN